MHLEKTNMQQTEEINALEKKGSLSRSGQQEKPLQVYKRHGLKGR